jgi:hypothetical protein
MGITSKSSNGWSNDVSRYSVETLMAITSELPAMQDVEGEDVGFDDDPTLEMPAVEIALLAWQCQEINTH